MNYLLQKGTDQVFVETKELLARKDMLQISTAEAKLRLAGKPVKSVVSGIDVVVPVKTKVKENDAGADQDDDGGGDEGEADKGNDLADSEIKRMFDEIDLMEDKAELEEIGRKYGFELHKNTGLEKSRGLVKAAIAKKLGIKVPD